MQTSFSLLTRVILVIISAGFLFNNSATASNLTVSAGLPVKIEVTADGTQPFTYQWQKNGTAISGATLATLTIAATTTADSATYTAVVANTMGSTISDGAVLTVNSTVTAPTITSQPASLAITAGQAAVFSVTASGSATLTYQWRKNGTAISGATSTIYSIATTTASDAASYSVAVTNSAGTATSGSAVLTVSTTPSIVEFTPLSFSTRGENAPVEGIAKLFDGQVATKWLDRSGTSWVQINLASARSLSSYSITSANDVPTRDPASWTLSGSNDGVTWTAIETRSGQSWSSRLLTRAFVLANASAFYRSFRFDFQVASGSITQLAELKLSGTNDIPTPPTITTQPASSTIADGSAASFSVTASGSATLTYQWAKNGTTIPGATGATYSIAATTVADAAAYSVKVTNLAGSVSSSNATLTILTAPTITTQPVPLAATTGQPAVFSVTASGSATLTYQWRKNGTAISGATSATYAIAATTAASAASYSVAVANSAGTATSSSAVLTVSTPPSLVELTPLSFSARGENGSTEGISKLFDGQVATKWLDRSGTSWVQFAFTSPTVLQAYSLTSANDCPERDPASWTLSGSNDGVTWTVIETRAAQSWASRLLVRDFVTPASAIAYTRFRFDFQATSGSVIQLAELELYGGIALPTDFVPSSYSARGQNLPNEGIEKLFDGNTSTKWLDQSGTSWVQINLASARSLSVYSITSANDVPTRDPASWTLSGSNDGVTWTVIDTRSGQSWNSRLLTRDFVLTNPSARFSSFRFEFQVGSGSITQLAELELAGTP